VEFTPTATAQEYDISFKVNATEISSNSGVDISALFTSSRMCDLRLGMHAEKTRPNFPAPSDFGNWAADDLSCGLEQAYNRTQQPGQVLTSFRFTFVPQALHSKPFPTNEPAAITKIPATANAKQTMSIVPLSMNQTNPNTQHRTPSHWTIEPVPNDLTSFFCTCAVICSTF